MPFPRFEPYRHLTKLIENEAFEPTFSWAMRMAIAATAPVIWGLATGHIAEASWVTLAAECICWVELKGSFGQRARVLAGGVVLAVFFALLGSVTGDSLWLSVLAMLVVGFISGLFKNLGDRGAGLATCVYVLFIFANAYPTRNLDELQLRAGYTAAGGIWNLLIGLAASLVIPARQPYRRMVALIWKANAALVQAVSKGWNAAGLRSSIRNIYLKEKEVRSAIDTSFHFYETMAHQVNRNEKSEYALAQLRKTTALTATHVTAISEELEDIRVNELTEEHRLKLYATLKALEEVMDRMASYVILLKPEEELLVASRITRFHKHLLLLKACQLPEDQPVCRRMKRVVQLLERTMRLIEKSAAMLQEMEDDLPVFRSYSLMKTLLVLHPRHWGRNIRLLFNFNTFTARYALRSAIAASAATFLYKWLEIDHGYWLAFTVIIVIQPYFGATFRKAIERVIGTVAGGLAGGLFIRLPAGLFLQETVLFLCFAFMVYFIRRNYAVSAFFITVSLVLLFDVEEHVNPTLIVTRALATMAGASLAIIAGFALLPNWDRKWLPIHLSNAIACNYKYFLATFFATQPVNWIRHKRSAESRNSNAFDSFSRYMQEPALKKRPYTVFYQLIMHNVRITRELNNIHLEQDSRKQLPVGATEAQTRRLSETVLWFNRVLEEVKKIRPEIDAEAVSESSFSFLPFALSSHQINYLDKLLYELKALHRALVDLRETILAEH